MKTSPRYIILITIITFIGLSALHAEDFEGTYKQAGATEALTVKKIGVDEYSLTCKDYVGVVFRDKASPGEVYKGVFRYNDDPKNVTKDVQNSGEHQNAVGYHLFKKISEGKYSVIYEWDLSHHEGKHTYEIERVK